MKLWRVRLVIRNKASGRAYGGEWVVAAAHARPAIQKVLSFLDLDGVDLVDQAAKVWDVTNVASLGPMMRAPDADISERRSMSVKKGDTVRIQFDDGASYQLRILGVTSQGFRARWLDGWMKDRECLVERSIVVHRGRQQGEQQ